jgi:hypothetical protein
VTAHEIREHVERLTKRKEGVTVKELAALVGVCVQTMEAHIHKDPQLSKKVQQLKTQARIDWATIRNVDGW